MGLYYRTDFIKDVRDKNLSVNLAKLDQIIELSDKKRGYILKSDLLQHYGLLVKEEDIGENSVLVEYISSISVSGVTISESLTLPIK